MFKAKPTKIVGLEPLVVRRHEYGQTSQFCQIQIQRAHCNKKQEKESEYGNGVSFKRLSAPIHWI